MKIAKDNYLKHYIYEYKKSMAVESPELQTKLTEILNYAIAISSNRDQFFELLSYGNYKLSTYQGEVSVDVIKQEMSYERRKINAYNRANSLLGETPVVKDTNPYAIVERNESREMLKKEIEKLSDEEKRVVTELCVNDSYIQSLIKEMNTTYDYIMTLQKNALARIYMRMSELNKEDSERPNGPVRKQSL